MRCRFLLNEKFRQGSAYRLVEWNQLNQKEKELLVNQYEEPEIYGFFQPLISSPGLTVKIAYREVAMLYFHLQYSNLLPHYFTTAATQASNESIARLVLDNILEIEWNNQFVGGSLAVSALYGETIFEENKIPDYLSALSMAAIQYALLLNEPDVKSLANRLYTFNTIPWDYQRRNIFSALTEHTTKEFLFKNADEGLKKDLNSNWNYSLTSEERGWLSWMRPRKTAAPVSSGSEIYKLYISPLIADLPSVFIKSIPIITASDAISFKTGSKLQGLLRPDKMVVYFETREAVLETSRLLENEFGSYTPQGVPFTAQTDKKGLLSQGVDPYPVNFPEGIEPSSWRTILTDELALAIIQSKTGNMNWNESIAFIRAKLLSAGIDINSWSSVN